MEKTLFLVIFTYTSIVLQANLINDIPSGIAAYTAVMLDMQK